MANQHTPQQPQTNPLQPGHNLRVSDLAPRLGVSKNTIWRWVRNKNSTFPKPIKLSDKVTVWKADDVLAWLDSKQQAA